MVSDLPGVGENYQDHLNCPSGSARFEGQPDDTGDLFARQDPEAMARYVKEYASGKGVLAWNFIDAGAKLNPSPAELQNMGADFQKVWKDFFEKKPDKPMMTLALSALYVSAEHK